MATCGVNMNGLCEMNCQDKIPYVLDGYSTSFMLVSQAVDIIIAGRRLVLPDYCGAYGCETV